MERKTWDVLNLPSLPFSGGILVFRLVEYGFGFYNGELLWQGTSQRRPPEVYTFARYKPGPLLHDDPRKCLVGFALYDITLEESAIGQYPENVEFWRKYGEEIESLLEVDDA